MIKFNYKLNKNFTKKIDHDFILSSMLISAEKVKNECCQQDYKNANFLIKLLTLANLRKLVFCKPEFFSHWVGLIYNNLPILADRYHQELIFKNANVDYNLINLNANSAQVKARIIEYGSYLLVELSRLYFIYDSKISRYLFNELRKEMTVASVKKTLRQMKLLSEGNSKILSNKKSAPHIVYPLWVNSFQNIFDYKKLSTKFGYELVKASGLRVCPYCNAETIRTIDGIKKHRPDIDHFLPKSKYPFFAASIFNFIPAGSACNRSFKGSVDVLTGYIHPLITGIDDVKLFDFNYDMINSCVQININDIDCFDNNRKLFEIDAVYQDPSYKEIYLSTRKQYKILKDAKPDENIFNDKDLMDTYFYTNKTNQNRVNMKFEREVLSDVIEHVENRR
ncbi:hypothetical protein GJV06_18980 [Enterobacteriaceae bacterium RIT691]|nr:hypothetical protein [Enterobacteriaceae bacterium RIT691]